MKNRFSIKASEGLCNCRIKLYPAPNGEWYPVEKMTSEKKIFNPSGLESTGWGVSPTLFDVPASAGTNTESHKEKNPESTERSLRRAKAKLLDLIRCNLDFKYFCTLTFNGAIVNRGEYAEVIRKFNQWCDNRVRRNGFKYVAVVERHKRSNGLHFHIISNECVKLCDSGTVKIPGHKKPVKASTADRYGVAEADRKTVYNISDWCYGFSTAIEITGDPLRVKVSSYLQKYLVKDTDRVGGRWYYSGGYLLRPMYRYCNDDFSECENTYQINVPGNSLKVLLLPFENGSQNFL